MARTGAQAEWRPEHGSDATWLRSDTGTRAGRPAQMLLVSSSTMEADESVDAPIGTAGVTSGSQTEPLNAAESPQALSPQAESPQALSAQALSAQALSAQALSAQRWTGYGRDRVYVTVWGGQRVGWLNLVTGDRVLIVAGEELMAGLVDGCIDAWLADPLNEPDRRGWHDQPAEQGANDPTNAVVDEQTIDLRDGAPIRAFLSRRRRRIQLRA